MAKPNYTPAVTVVNVTIKGTAPYSQSKYFTTIEFPLLHRESKDKYDERLWKEKGHWDKDGNMVVPNMQIRALLTQTASYLSETIPGKGKNTYTKHFKSGIIVPHDFELFDNNGQKITRDNVQIEVAYPETSSGNKVTSRYPIVHTGWVATGDIIIVDQTISLEVFTKYLCESGLYKGIGRYRVGLGFDYGRFTVEDITVKQSPY